MDGAEQVVGFGGDDGAGRNCVALRVLPQRPQPSEGKRFSGLHSDAHGGLCAAKLLPLVEAVGENQATPAFEGAAVGGLLGEGLGSGIDHATADGGGLGPVGYEAPSHEAAAPLLAVVDDCEDVVGGGHVVVGLQLQPVPLELESAGQFCQIRG